jgi:hypothetical protein
MIAQALVESAYPQSGEDVSAIDVVFTPGQLVCVVDGHGVINQARPNPVVNTVRQNLDHLFNQNIENYKPEEKSEEKPEPRKRGRPPLDPHLKKTVTKPLIHAGRGRPRKNKSAGAAKHQQNLRQQMTNNSPDNTPESQTSESSKTSKGPAKK